MALARGGHITLTNANSYWYAHNTAEFLQRIAFSEGKLELPDDVKRLAMDMDSCRSDWRDGIDPIDGASIGVFEISTRIVKKYGSFVLHSTCVSKRQFKEAQDVLMSFEELEEHIRLLRSRFSKLIISCNIGFLVNLIDKCPRRGELNDFLTGIPARIGGVRVIDPNKYIHAFDPRKDLEDSNHFLPHFVRVMSNVYLEEIEAFDA